VVKAPTRKTDALGRQGASVVPLGRKLRRRFRRSGSAYVLVLPAMAAAVAFLYIPMALSAFWSFTEFNGLLPPRWVGLDNYTALLADPLFLRAVRNTVVFVVFAQGLGPVFGLASALLLNNKLRFRALFRAAYFVPVMTSLVVVATIWKMLLNSHGLINIIFGYLHLPTTSWLANPSTALPSVIGASIWQGLGFETVLFLAALQSIPRDYYEAALVDGANVWQRFRHVTLPGLRPTIVFVYVIGIIQSSQVFDQIFVMTQGGPIQSTNTVVYELINRFNSLQLGKASAIAYLLAVALALLSLLQLRVFERRD
jgi:ABC-type sugar transport system permease subunit